MRKRPFAQFHEHTLQPQFEAELINNGSYPARSAFAVKALPKGALVEVECIAVK